MTSTPGSLDKPSSSSGGGTDYDYGWTRVDLTEDKKVTNSTSLTTITEWDIPISVGEIVMVESYITVLCDASADLKVSVIGPTGSKGRFGGSSEETTSRTIGTTRTMATQGATVPTSTKIRWQVYAETTAGTVSFRFAQSVAHASDCNIKEHSWMKWKKVTF